MPDHRPTACTPAVRITHEEIAACVSFRNIVLELRRELIEAPSTLLQKPEDRAAVENGSLSAQVVNSAAPGPVSKVLLINGHPISEN